MNTVLFVEYSVPFKGFLLFRYKITLYQAVSALSPETEKGDFTHLVALQSPEFSDILSFTLSQGYLVTPYSLVPAGDTGNLLEPEVR